MYISRSDKLSPMNDDVLRQAKGAFLQGVKHFEVGDMQAARTSFQEALRLAPGRPSVLLNLGLTQARLGEHGSAEGLLRAAADAEPDSLTTWTALAHTHFAMSHWELGVQSHERALALAASDPEFAVGASHELRRQLAECLARLGRHPQAAQHCQTLLAHDDTNPKDWTFLGDLQREMGQLAEAALSYGQALARGGDSDMLNHCLAALSPQAQPTAPPRRYVQALFDEYAADFDDHLVGLLHYQGHEVLVQHLPLPEAGRWGRVLDMGCGTGLCGPLVRQQAQHLIGVDLSPAMVAKSAERGVYDELATADIQEHLSQPGEPYDLVLAADVFIYVGPLERVFQLLAQRMRVGACLAFTIEPARDGPGVQLLPSLRYAHTDAYIRALAQTHGFGEMRHILAPIRHDQDQPVEGRYIYLRRL